MRIAVIFFCMALACNELLAVEYTGKKYKDPFGGTVVEVSAPVAPKPKDPLNLQGIVWNTKNPQVVINGKVLSIGNEIEGAKVMEITKGAVKMKYLNHDEEFILKLKSERVP